LFRAALGALVSVVCATAAWAQNYPTRPITLIVPFAAGGTTDAIGRVIAEHMSGTLGQQLVIENVGGGGGMIGAGRVARAAPDGYTILLHQPGLAAGVSLYSKLQFDVEKDLIGVGLVNAGPLIIAGHKSIPANTAAELVKWMKESGRHAKFAHAGAGAIGHLCAAIFAQAVGAQVDMIPYRGGGPALSDTVAGHADLTCASIIIVMEHVKAGNLKGFGIAGKERFAGLPQVESLVQAGYPALNLEFWHALFAPAGTPRPIIDKLNAAMRRAVVDPKVVKTFDDNGLKPYPAEEQTPEKTTALLKSEIARWGDVIRANKIEVQP
jgi:tripartite-type tricarboxylate transporter receptor subunit TctC